MTKRTLERTCRWIGIVLLAGCSSAATENATKTEKVAPEWWTSFEELKAATELLDRFRVDSDVNENEPWRQGKPTHVSIFERDAPWIFGRPSHIERTSVSTELRWDKPVRWKAKFMETVPEKDFLKFDLPDHWSFPVKGSKLRTDYEVKVRAPKTDDEQWASIASGTTVEFSGKLSVVCMRMGFGRLRSWLVFLTINDATPVVAP